MERRPLGSTGAELSIVGFGGVVVMNETQADADDLVAEAIDGGVNYFDVAPSYGDSEDRLGPALEPYRANVFLACKTGKRTKDEAAAELRESLSRMRTDYFDLYQLHAMTTRADLETALGPGGALEAFIEARDAGLIHHIGFSAHSAEIACELMDQFDFASVLFPLNWMEYQNAGFGPQVIEKAIQKGVGRLALKAMARQKWPEGADKSAFPKCWYEPCSDAEEAAMALAFTLSQPITAAIPPGDPSLFRLALEVAQRFTPITDSEREELHERAQGLEPFFRLAA